MTTTDLVALVAAVAAGLGAVGALLAAFVDRPRQARHLAVERRPGADDVTPPAPWRTMGSPDTRPMRRGEVLEALAERPAAAAGPLCTLCDDGVHVIGEVCIWCGGRPVMRP